MDGPHGRGQRADREDGSLEGGRQVGRGRGGREGRGGGGGAGAAQRCRACVRDATRTAAKSADAAVPLLSQRWKRGKEKGEGLVDVAERGGEGWVGGLSQVAYEREIKTVYNLELLRYR